MKRYECTTCGVVTNNKKHLCQAEEVAEGRSCGGDREKEKAMCDPMQQKADFRCGFCDRPSSDPELLCNPEKRPDGQTDG